jgi:hypothetical protein
LAGCSTRIHRSKSASRDCREWPAGATIVADQQIARDANARNNAMHQELRLERWRGVRDAVWELVDTVLAAGARVALVGAGSCDDVPLARIATRATAIDLLDFDPTSTARAVARLGVGPRARVRARELDVTGGSADLVLAAVRDDAPLPDALPLPYGPFDDAPYDLIIGDMLYTQLLHAGLLALDVHGERQQRLMQRYDPHLTNALVQRIQSSLAPGGHAIHVHDVACWTDRHPQPVTLDQALERPDGRFELLRRHDACDPHLVLERLGARIVRTQWWRWPFEPKKEFLVRATVTRAEVGAGTTIPWG